MRSIPPRKARDRAERFCPSARHLIVIPGCARLAQTRNPSGHEVDAEWIPGSRFASPGMTKEPFIKIRHKFATGKQLFRQKLGILKLGVYCGQRTLLFKKREACLSMPIFKYFTVVGSTLLAFLFVSNAYLNDDESNLRFDGSLYQSAMYAPRPEETLATTELRFTRDVTPAVRVKEVFAVFVPNERRRGKRHS